MRRKGLHQVVRTPGWAAATQKKQASEAGKCRWCEQQNRHHPWHDMHMRVVRWGIPQCHDHADAHEHVAFGEHTGAVGTINNHWFTHFCTQLYIVTTHATTHAFIFVMVRFSCYLDSKFRTFVFTHVTNTHKSWMYSCILSHQCYTWLKMSPTFSRCPRILNIRQRILLISKFLSLATKIGIKQTFAASDRA